ncbi:hypothetical protein PYCC9005_004692 [Savitreella phatthalungensis]
MAPLSQHQNSVASGPSSSPAAGSNDRGSRRRSSLASVVSLRLSGGVGSGGGSASASGGLGHDGRQPPVLPGRSYYATSFKAPAMSFDTREGGSRASHGTDTVTPSRDDIRLQTQRLAEQSSFDTTTFKNSLSGRTPFGHVRTGSSAIEDDDAVLAADDTIQEVSEPESTASSFGGISKLLKMSPSDERAAQRTGSVSLNKTSQVHTKSPSIMTETSALVPAGPIHDYGGLHRREDGCTDPSADGLEGSDDVEAQSYGRDSSYGSSEPLWKRPGAHLRRAVTFTRQDAQSTAKTAVSSIPAVVLGLLLNILDALSYGMILFPLGTPIFASLGPDGISMFYISCIVSQLVFSCGGSIFKGGIGSEMIEVVPFFHQMAYSIMAEVGDDKPDAVIATTITAYALSSMLTGLVFYLLGRFRLGRLIGYFPRHILIGCIGGVGWFLFVTGLEVSARLSGNLEYNLDTLKHLIRADTWPLWTIPLGLAVLLEVLQRLIYHPLLVPVFFCLVPAVFYIVVAAVPALHVEPLRQAGWIFAAPASGKAWYDFYGLYKFGQVHWGALLQTVPAMFALTFFGILHVPINIPALGVSTCEDNVDVDRELKAHGVSNALSGLLGSIQNYLVYTNSILFIRSGGNSRVAGLMLAAGTAVIMFIGPALIGFIPIMVVGALIFLLGMDLLKEALIDTIGKVDLVEYLTIVIIVLVMGVFDFVLGIVVGIILACIFFVLQTAKRSPIRTRYSGVIATSTVRRPPAQQRFLREAGHQMQIYKLTGYLFFGSITYVEKVAREHVDDELFRQRPIRFLILDLTFAHGMDFSAAEAFTRMHRLLTTRRIHLILCGVKPNGEISRGLRSVGLLQESSSLKTFGDLNSALEWCENVLLTEALRWTKSGIKPHDPDDEEDGKTSPASFLDVPEAPHSSLSVIDAQAHSPRGEMLMRAASSTLMPTLKSLSGPAGAAANGSAITPNRKGSIFSSFKPPLPLLLTVFRDLTDEREDFWHRVAPLFKREDIPGKRVLWEAGTQAACFYVLESGMIQASYELEIGALHENIAPGTVAGELPFLSDTPRTARLTTMMDCIVWRFDRKSLQALREMKGGLDMVTELYRIGLKLSSERLTAILSYGITSS